jgi:hypothetical protein
MVEASKLQKNSTIQVPDHAVVLEFGAVAALFDVAERLGVRQIIIQRLARGAKGFLLVPLFYWRQLTEQSIQ